MSFENLGVFTKENLDKYLRELSREYKKLGGRNMPIEIVLIGGAAVIENYGFREMTTDIDAILPAVSIMKEAINRVGDRCGLPNGWLNADFMKTESYSRRLSEFSIPYKTFNQVLNVRMVTGAYLIAMKLRAGRKYKNDLSDVVGILEEQDRMGRPISYEQIDTAVKNLYGGWEGFSDDSVSFLQIVLARKNYARIYEQIRGSEAQAREALLAFEKQHPGTVREEQVDEILKAGEKKGGRISLLAYLREHKQQEKADSSPKRNERSDRDER